MTEEKKRELRQLLEEARGSLVIRSRSRSRSSSSVDVDTYRQYLQLLWTFYPPYSLWGPMSFELEDVSETAKSKLLSFIRDEFAPFICEDKILSARRFLQAGPSHGLSLEEHLEQLLKIAIVQGIKEAVSAFDKYIGGTHDGFFQYIALLEGITLKTEIQVFEGIRLVPLPNLQSEVPRYLPDFSSLPFGTSFAPRTVLIIDLFVSPILHKPFPRTIQEYSELVNPLFRDEVSSGKILSFKENDFYEKFCQALSLAYNFEVKTVVRWRFSAEREFFDPYDSEAIVSSNSPLGAPTEVGEDQIDQAKHLYEILVNPDSDVAAKLRISIDRWLKSKTPQNPVDKIIDLGIAFEALYVPDGGGDLTYKFSIRAARHLGTDREHRKELLKKFGQIYGCRSDAVHSGKLDERIRFGGERIPLSDFIKRTQDLCRESIIKILEDGDIPDWNSLLLGGEGEQASS